MWREILKWKNIMRRETQHLVCVQRAGELACGEQICMQRFCSLVVGDKHQRRRVGCADEVGKVQSSRGRGEAGHTSPARAGREMATHTLEDWRAFKVRDQLADERKNHAVSSVALQFISRTGTLTGG